MSETRITVTSAAGQTRLTVSPIGLQGLPGDGSLTADELAAIQGAATPSAVNVFATMADVVSISDTPTNGVTDVGISSNWAYDHVAASDPHPGYALESAANIRAVSIQSGNYPLAATDSVVVFTATATATLPAATGSGRTYRIVCRAGTLTIDPANSDTIKGETMAVLSAGEDLILTDTATGVWE